MGGAINDGDSNKENLNSPGGQTQVPSDQKETGSNALANISEFLRNKEGDATIPGRNLISEAKDKYTFNTARRI